MGLLDLIFPKSCLSCKKEDTYICQSCLEKVKHPIPVCPMCQKPSIDGFTHTKCEKKLGLNGLSSVWKYEGVIRKALISLKYHYVSEIAAELSQLMQKELEGNKFLVPRSFCLIPVPIHWYRENVRGFNQSFELGNLVSGLMGWNFAPRLLIRKKYTTPQVQLTGEKRRKNIHGAFALKEDFKAIGKNYILFDDVYTTGSTMKEATKVLKRNGAKKVWGLTVAR